MGAAKHEIFFAVPIFFALRQEGTTEKSIRLLESFRSINHVFFVYQESLAVDG